MIRKFNRVTNAFKKKNRSSVIKGLGIIVYGTDLNGRQLAVRANIVVECDHYTLILGEDRFNNMTEVTINATYDEVSRGILTNLEQATNDAKHLEFEGIVNCLSVMEREE